jgi:hypothetical protein
VACLPFSRAMANACAIEDHTSYQNSRRPECESFMESWPVNPTVVMAGDIAANPWFAPTFTKRVQ